MIRMCFALLAMLALPAHASETGHPLTLWQVAGANNSVYLLGSIHLLRSEDYPLPSAFDAAYDDAEVLVMEVDMDDLDPLAAQILFTTYGVLKDATTLRDLMGDQLYKEAVAAAEVIDIPLEMLSKTEPWYAAMTIEMM
ncbi:MAG: TraB/GumN family protein, partial [Gammaproteobacteria bacterium]|nr:TraB/GumN family protein [Gammaproteobacteria bacterium]